MPYKKEIHLEQAKQYTDNLLEHFSRSKKNPNQKTQYSGPGDFDGFKKNLNELKRLLDDNNASDDVINNKMKIVNGQVRVYSSATVHGELSEAVIGFDSILSDFSDKKQISEARKAAGKRAAEPKQSQRTEQKEQQDQRYKIKERLKKPNEKTRTPVSREKPQKPQTSSTTNSGEKRLYVKTYVETTPKNSQEETNETFKVQLSNLKDQLIEKERDFTEKLNGKEAEGNLVQQREALTAQQQNEEKGEASQEQEANQEQINELKQKLSDHQAATQRKVLEHQEELAILKLEQEQKQELSKIQVERLEQKIKKSQEDAVKSSSAHHEEVDRLKAENKQQQKELSSQHERESRERDKKIQQLKEEKADLEQEKADLEQEKADLDEEKIKLGEQLTGKEKTTKEQQQQLNEVTQLLEKQRQELEQQAKDLIAQAPQDSSTPELSALSTLFGLGMNNEEGSQALEYAAMKSMQSAKKYLQRLIKNSVTPSSSNLIQLIKHNKDLKEGIDNLDKELLKSQKTETETQTAETHETQTIETQVNSPKTTDTSVQSEIVDDNKDAELEGLKQQIAVLQGKLEQQQNIARETKTVATKAKVDRLERGLKTAITFFKEQNKELEEKTKDLIAAEAPQDSSKPKLSGLDLLSRLSSDTPGSAEYLKVVTKTPFEKAKENLEKLIVEGQDSSSEEDLQKLIKKNTDLQAGIAALEGLLKPEETKSEAQEDAKSAESAVVKDLEQQIADLKQKDQTAEQEKEKASAQAKQAEQEKAEALAQAEQAKQEKAEALAQAKQAEQTKQQLTEKDKEIADLKEKLAAAEANNPKSSQGVEAGTATEDAATQTDPLPLEPAPNSPQEKTTPSSGQERSGLNLLFTVAKNQADNESKTLADKFPGINMLQKATENQNPSIEVVPPPEEDTPDDKPPGPPEPAKEPPPGPPPGPPGPPEPPPGPPGPPAPPSRLGEVTKSLGTQTGISQQQRRIVDYEEILQDEQSSEQQQQPKYHASFNREKLIEQLKEKVTGQDQQNQDPEKPAVEQPAEETTNAANFDEKHLEFSSTNSKFGSDKPNKLEFKDGMNSQNIAASVIILQGVAESNTTERKSFAVKMDNYKPEDLKQILQKFNKGLKDKLSQSDQQSEDSQQLFSVKIQYNDKDLEIKNLVDTHNQIADLIKNNNPSIADQSNEETQQQIQKKLQDKITAFDKTLSSPEAPTTPQRPHTAPP